VITPTVASGSAITEIVIGATSTTADTGANRGVYWNPYPGGTGQYALADQTGDYEIPLTPLVSDPTRAAVIISNASVPGINTIRYIRMSGTGIEPTW